MNFIIFLYSGTVLETSEPEDYSEIIVKYLFKNVLPEKSLDAHRSSTKTE